MNLNALGKLINLINSFYKVMTLNNSFEMELSKIQPSQLYISKQKLAKVNDNFSSKDLSTLDAIPIKKIDTDVFYTDGHTRAFAVYQAGFRKINVIWDEEELDWEIYKICIKWCKDEGIYSIADLRDRVVDHKKYEILWYKKCDDLSTKLSVKRAQQNQMD